MFSSTKTVSGVVSKDRLTFAVKDLPQGTPVVAWLIGPGNWFQDPVELVTAADGFTFTYSHSRYTEWMWRQHGYEIKQYMRCLNDVEECSVRVDNFLHLDSAPFSFTVNGNGHNWLEPELVCRLSHYFPNGVASVIQQYASRAPWLSYTPF